AVQGPRRLCRRVQATAGRPRGFGSGRPTKLRHADKRHKEALVRSEVGPWSSCRYYCTPRRGVGMLHVRHVKAVRPIAWRGAVAQDGRKWLRGEPARALLSGWRLKVVTPVTGPNPATHLIQGRREGEALFCLAELRSYRYRIERFLRLDPGE